MHDTIEEKTANTIEDNESLGDYTEKCVCKGGQYERNLLNGTFNAEQAHIGYSKRIIQLNSSKKSFGLMLVGSPKMLRKKLEYELLFLCKYTSV
ncbi:hypothetical protein [Mesobacillus jeotgali]|uniref:Uncharacterized protein n=1 Tax=Mesobacillus jeotgali TaxID=129985 RepID=A0ABY9VJV2_9BACI|nr:hypothetical protein [Mesobacillus jeotgali]WNF21241.1 hypothetical protein RH061_13635 [Mesobacillus jeotgali]